MEHRLAQYRTFQVGPHDTLDNYFEREYVITMLEDNIAAATLYRDTHVTSLSVAELEIIEESLEIRRRLLQWVQWQPGPHINIAWYPITDDYNDDRDEQNPLILAPVPPGANQ